MRISQKTKLLPLFALMIIIGAFLFAGTTSAYAAEDSPDTPELVVKEVWLTGDTLHISVTDGPTGVGQTLELNLREYAKPSDEYVTVQATDSGGRTSNSVSFKNPYYIAGNETTENAAILTNSGTETSTTPSESAVSNGKPFTPDGTGTVLDNATDGDGKEFFSITTEDGNVFYLIVDRQRDSENVYLLNAVNEDDLASLAKSGDGKSVSAISSPEVTATPAPVEPTPASTPEPAPEKSGNNGMLIFIVIAVAAVGGAGYYFKIVRPKKNAAADSDYDDDGEDDFDGDKELDVSDEDDDGEDGDDE
jgi:hypothetical protein